MKINGLYWVTEVEHPQPVRDRKTKQLRASKKPPRVISRRLAIITDGQYESNGRISNFWNWTYFDESNTVLTNEKAHGYPNGHPYIFEEEKGYDINIVLSKKIPASQKKGGQANG